MSRKYKQTGYQDGDRAVRQPRTGGPRPQNDGPRGRGLGAPTETVFKCASCGHRQEPGLEPPARCSNCDADLHTCTHCAEFDSSAPFECRREITQRISGKAVCNECELFRPKLTQEFGAEVEKSSDAKDAFDDLFNF